MAAPDDIDAVDAVDVVDAIAVLRRARPRLPEEVTSPASEAAQALLEEILSMPIPTPELEVEVDVDVDALRPGDSSPRPRPRRAVLAAAVAVALAGAAAVAVAQTGGGDGEAVEVGPASGAATATPAESGHLRTTWDLRWDAVPPGAQTTSTYSWSGDDVRVQRGLEETRIVDGRAWALQPDLSALPPEGGSPTDELPFIWSATEPHRPDVLGIDPATLLDQLAAAGPFTPVGDEDVEGVPTERRRATNPASTPLDVLFVTPYFPDDATVTGLEVWVDGDEQVRRVDVTTSGVAQGEDFTETTSYVWYGLGEPVTVEPPTAGEVVDPRELADLLEYTIDESSADAAADEAVEVVPTPEAETGG